MTQKHVGKFIMWHGDAYKIISQDRNTYSAISADGNAYLRYSSESAQVEAIIELTEIERILYGFDEV